MDNSFSTLELLTLTPPEMEYKYVVVSHVPCQQHVGIIDISEAGFPATGFNLLLSRGWCPVREIRFGGGGESSSMSVLVLLEREKHNGNS